jgi:hypothetical protein
VRGALDRSSHRGFAADSGVEKSKFLPCKP